MSFLNLMQFGSLYSDNKWREVSCFHTGIGDKWEVKCKQWNLQRSPLATVVHFALYRRLTAGIYMYALRSPHYQ